jgi:NTP pyrophosphatase (non-canonical NTP hydrolase)
MAVSYTSLMNGAKGARRIDSHGITATNAIMQSIERELDRAEALHPEYPESMYKRFAIMAEESGEVAKAILDWESYKSPGTWNHIREELIQTAAMCVRMLKNMEMEDNEEGEE